MIGTKIFQKKSDLIDKLSYLCSTQRGGQKKGHIYKRQESRKSYPDFIKKLDWILGCLQMGALIVKANLKKKAQELIRPYNESFKASYIWLMCF